MDAQGKDYPFAAGYKSNEPFARLRDLWKEVKITCIKPLRIKSTAPRHWSTDSNAYGDDVTQLGITKDLVTKLTGLYNQAGQLEQKRNELSRTATYARPAPKKQPSARKKSWVIWTVSAAWSENPSGSPSRKKNGLPSDLEQANARKKHQTTHLQPPKRECFKRSIPAQASP